MANIICSFLFGKRYEYGDKEFIELQHCIDKIFEFIGTCSMINHFYQPQRSCGQGNIFTPVCHSVHRGGGLPQCMLGCHPSGRRHHPPLCQGDPPAKETPRKEAPPAKETPPPEGGIPRKETPREGDLPAIRSIRILLECILVYYLYYTYQPRLRVGNVFSLFRL